MRFKSLQEGKYEIQALLGQGGYGITYLAAQTMLGRLVAIKEFFMKDYCERASEGAEVTMGTRGSREMVLRYREKFKKEAATLARLNHPGIVRVIDMFEENNTYYYVMEYADGPSLSQIIKAREKLPIDEALAIIKQVADAVRYLHQERLCHYDIKPANILTSKKGQVILADFGLAKQYDEQGEETSTTPVGKSKGYAPPEQYRAGGVSDFSPETDIYALAATLYKLLTGITPIESLSRDDKEIDLSILPATLVAPLQKAMCLKRKERFHSVEEFMRAIMSRESQMEEEDETTHIDLTEPEIMGQQTKMSLNIKIKSLYDKLYPFIVGIGIIIVILASIGIWCTEISPQQEDTINDSVAVLSEERKNNVDSFETMTANEPSVTDTAQAYTISEEDKRQILNHIEYDELLTEAEKQVNNNDLENARKALAYLVETEDFQYAYYAYAVCLFKLKEFNEAKRWAQKSVEKKTNTGKALMLIEKIDQFLSLKE